MLDHAGLAFLKDAWSNPIRQRRQTNPTQYHCAHPDVRSPGSFCKTNPIPEPRQTNPTRTRTPGPNPERARHRQGANRRDQPAILQNKPNSARLAQNRAKRTHSRHHSSVNPGYRDAVPLHTRRCSRPGSFCKTNPLLRPRQTNPPQTGNPGNPRWPVSQHHYFSGFRSFRFSRPRIFSSIGVPLNPNRFLNWFIRYRSCEKCRGPALSVNKTKDGGRTPV